MMTEPKEIFIMLVIMFISGLLSSMNIWAAKLSDIRFHLNDIYMALLMCGWCLILMGIYYINPSILLIGIISTAIIFYCIRNQLFIDEGFINFDKYNLSIVPTFLKSLLKFYNTIVILSHIDVIQDTVDETAEIFFDHKNASSAITYS
jgi:hypothetical protein